MMKYSKNLILCGEIDFYCLLCKESFETTDEVDKHIRWEQHRKLIKQQEYLPNLKKDGVYKLEDNMYYCETCNYLTPGFNTIKNHVKEESHQAKGSKSKVIVSEGNGSNPNIIMKEALVKRDFDFVIVSKIVINKKVWHGVLNNYCMICNIAVGNFSAHTRLPSHMISLIQAEVKKEKEDQVYRKINDDTSYCFKCKKTISNALLSEHWLSEDHTGKSKDGTGKVKQLFEIDKENSIATCVVCNESLPWSFLPMHQHKKEHIAKGEWTKDENEDEQEFMQMFFQDKGKLRSELKKYGKDNFIKMNEGGSKGFCTLCNTYISAHLRNFRQHVNGVRHNSFLELKGLVKKTKKTEKPQYKTKSFVHFYREVIHLKSSHTFLVPSAELCIDILSFALMAPIDHKFKKFICFVCDEVCSDVAAHLKSDHRNKLFKTDVITTLKGEFIREVRPGLYHCGVCNMAYAGWSVLEKHLNLFKHRYENVEAHKNIEELIDPSTLNCDGIRLEPFNFPEIKTEDLLD